MSRSAIADRSKRRAALCWIVFAACGGSTLFLEPPPSDDRHRTLIFALEADGALVVDVHDLARDTFVFDTTLDAEAVVGTALLYDASVEQLGLAPGRLEAVASEVCGATALPAADGVYRFTTDGARSNGWEESAPTAAVDAFRFAGPCVCPAFEVVREFDIPDKRHVFAVAAVDDTRALLFAAPSDGDPATAYWLTDADATEVAFDYDDRTDAIHVDGEDIWLGARDVLYRGTSVGDFVVTATVGDDAILSIHGRADDLFFATEEGALWRSDGDVVERWADREIVGATSQRAVVLRVGPGRVVHAPPQLLDFDVYQDKNLVDRHVALADTRGLNVMVELDDFGVFAIYEGSDALVYRGGELLSLGAPELAFPQDLIRLAPDTALYGTIAGELQAFVVGHGFCATRAPTATAPRIQNLVRLGERVLVIGEPPGSRTVLRVQVLASGRSEG